MGPPVGDLLCEKKWVFFTRYWIGFPLSCRMKNWAFLQSNEVPKHLGDAKPPIYRVVLTMVERIGVDFNLLPNYSVKTFYSRLISPAPQQLLCTSPPHLIGIASGVTFAVVLERTGNMTMCGGSLTAWSRRGHT